MALNFFVWPLDKSMLAPSCTGGLHACNIATEMVEDKSNIFSLTWFATFNAFSIQNYSLHAISATIDDCLLVAAIAHKMNKKNTYNYSTKNEEKTQQHRKPQPEKSFEMIVNPCDASAETRFNTTSVKIQNSRMKGMAEKIVRKCLLAPSSPTGKRAGGNLNPSNYKLRSPSRRGPNPSLPKRDDSSPFRSYLFRRVEMQETIQRQEDV